MQDSIPVIIEVAAPAAELTSQTAAYAAADASMFAATQAAAAQSVQSAKDLVQNGAILAAEGCAVVSSATVAGIALPVILAGAGIAGLAGLGVYALHRRGVTFAGIKQAVSDRIAQAQPAPGEWPQWEGYTDEAIWNDLDLLDAATRPEPSADELELDEINWDELAMECAA